MGGGVIGLSLAWELRGRGASVLVVEKGELGREASWAAGGMLAWCDPHLPVAARGLARLSQQLYGEFIEGLQEVSGRDVDVRRVGTLVLDEEPPGGFAEDCRAILPSELTQLEPELRPSSNVQLWPEWSVDPRGLVTALIAACAARGVDVTTGHPGFRIAVSGGRAVGVETASETLAGSAVVNCAGAWAAEVVSGLKTCPTPTRPVKGQMLALKPAREVLRHVVRAPGIYLIPRGDGRIVVGATVEEAGFDTVTQPAAIARLLEAAVALLPALGTAPVQETWAGLRPGSPDGLPILGETALSGYFVASGHFRDGILLAPATARVVGGMVLGDKVDGFEALSPQRFG